MNYPALSVFMFIYFLIVAKKFFKLNVEPWMSMLLGAVLMVLLRVLTADQATSAINLQVIVFLFGSLSKGRIRSDPVREPSDIDLIVIGEKGAIEHLRADLLTFMNTEISLKYGIVVYPVVLSVEEYLRGCPETSS